MTDKRKKIFDWNHISDKLSEDEVDELKSYYKIYHRKCWAYKQAVKRYKKFKVIGNSVSILTGAGGIIAAIVTHGIALVGIKTAAILIKSYMGYQSLDMKIQNCTYAYQSYQHLLIELKDMLRSGDYNSSFHTQLKNIDDFTIDICPGVDKFLSKYNDKFIP